MDLSFSPEEEAFRQDVRAFIADAKPKLPDIGAAESADRSKEEYLAWHKLLYKKGWVAPLWPKEYGGTGWNVTPVGSRGSPRRWGAPLAWPYAYPCHVGAAPGTLQWPSQKAGR